MARLKTKLISTDELQCKEALITELRNKINSEDYDFTKISILIKGKGSPPFIVNIDNAIKSMERYYLCNKHLIETINSEQIIKKGQLARMLGISRPTLNKWIFHGFIQPVPLKCLSGETFPVKDVLRQLNSYKSGNKK